MQNTLQSTDTNVSNLSHHILLNHLNIGIIILAKDMTILFWNEWVSLHSGIPFNKVKGAPLNNVFSELTGSRLLHLFEQSLSLGLSSHVSTKFNDVTLPLFKRGLNHEAMDKITHSIHIKPLNNTNEEKQCLIQIFDVTNAFLREKAMRQQAEKLKQSNDDLEKFAYVASHDLQEPLRTIQGFGSLLIQDYASKLADEGQDFLKRIIKGAERLQVMIQDLLAFSQIANKGYSLCVIDLNVFIENVRLSLDSQITEVHAQFDVQQLPKICADESMLQHLLQNLISNGIKFRKKDTSPVIKIYCCERTETIEDENYTSNENFITLCIEDNGIGFDNKFRKRIFDTFERLHSKSKYSGTGLGLALCQRIVEKHNGKIFAHGTPGEGAKFFVTLPTCKDCIDQK
ncbi:MAG: ATP-binding protein [Pseudomonadota bacterium]